MVIPVGDRQDQELCVIRKQDGKISRRYASGCRFVPLLGREGWQDKE